MRYFFDTEFIEDGRTIDLLSLGIVSQDGDELYFECAYTDKRRANRWVRKNVLPKMTGAPLVTSPADAAERVVHFCAGRDRPEFWAYYCAYDWVALCQLFGEMIYLPKDWPMYCNDFKQWLAAHGNPPMRKLPEGSAHNALADALHLKNEWNRLRAEVKPWR